MTNLVAVDNKAHKNLRINPAKAELHAEKLNLIPIVIAEFTNLAVQHPIVITKHSEKGEFVCSALFGFAAEENLFWQKGQWQGLYLPLEIQRQPFFIGDADDDMSKNSGDYVVCIDVDSPTVSEYTSVNSASDLPTLFTETGEESPYFQQAKQFLAQLLQGKIDNEKLIAALKKFDLIQALSVEITFINEQSTRLNGLYTINQEKLAALSNVNIAELHQQNLLQPIYTMITSLGQLYPLIERKNDRLGK
ncbi:MAG: SapC family protein [Colwellia sp.]|nr:SapC family protein [Colwellia sp.]